MMKRLSFSVLIALATTANASDFDSEMKNCSKLDDSLARLVCFDNLAVKVEKNNAAEKKTVQEKTVSVPEKVVAPAPVIAVAPKPEVKSESEQINEFGIEHIKKARDGKMDTIFLIVSSVSKNAKNRLILSFENGQRWIQKDGKVLLIKPGDQARIKKGVMGAIYLSKVGNNRNIRVKRIK